MKIADFVEIALGVEGSATARAASWGAVLRMRNVTRDLSGSSPKATRDRMEATALVEALWLLERPCEVLISAGPEYLKPCTVEKLVPWAKARWLTATGNPVPNADLWQDFLRQKEMHDITFMWRRGEPDTADERRAARLALKAMEDKGTAPSPSPMR